MKRPRRSRRPWFWTVRTVLSRVIFGPLLVEVFSFLARCWGLHRDTFTTALCNLRTQPRTSATLAHRNDQFLPSDTASIPNLLTESFLLTENICPLWKWKANEELIFESFDFSPLSINLSSSVDQLKILLIILYKVLLIINKATIDSPRDLLWYLTTRFSGMC